MGHGGDEEDLTPSSERKRIKAMAKQEPLPAREYEIMFEVEDSYWWYEGIREIAREVLKSHLPKKDRLKILDAGCGTGGNLKTLQQFGVVYGIEVSKVASEFLKKRAFNRFAVACVEQMPFRDSEFELLTTFYVNEYVQQDFPAFQEYFRVLKPGGFLYVAEVAFESLRAEHDLAVGIIRRYRKRELNEKLKAVGFEIARSSYYNTFLFPPIFLLRQARKILFPPSSAEEAKSDFRLAPRFLHGLFKKTLFWEASILKHINLPFGVSVFTLARKPSSW